MPVSRVPVTKRSERKPPEPQSCVLAESFKSPSNLQLRSAQPWLVDHTDDLATCSRSAERMKVWVDPPTWLDGAVTEFTLTCCPRFVPRT